MPSQGSYTLNANFEPNHAGAGSNLIHDHHEGANGIHLNHFELRPLTLLQLLAFHSV